ncbi:MAG: hypothetical protein JWO41_491 [Candidatus Saccharibacteria bacterium]|nr:hypothetical protein [Candidatus Saccharibacteria bacterium]
MWSKILAGALVFATLPATSTYQLNSYGFGSGSASGVHTTTYSLEGSTGDLSGGRSSTAAYTTKPGFIESAQAQVPLVSAFDNNGGQYYNKLHITINEAQVPAPPSDTEYLISVSTDNFASPANYTYLQPDGTLSSTLNTSDYQSYTTLGGSSGTLIIGLLANTTYYARVRAVQGNFTESSYSPTVSITTANPSLTFNLITSDNSPPPYSIDFGTLTAGSITQSSNTIDTTLSTNGAVGGDIYIVAQNGALVSSTSGGRIDSVTTDLTSASHGFGAQSTFIGQTSGGPFSIASPFTVSGTNVALIGTTAQSLYTSSAPITGGLGKLRLKAKPSNTDVAATDYREVLTFIAAGNF